MKTRTLLRKSGAIGKKELGEIHGEGDYILGKWGDEGKDGGEF